METTYMYGVYDSAYVCKECDCSMPMNMDGEDASVHIMYCPFCGRKISAWYADEASAEWFEDEQNETNPASQINTDRYKNTLKEPEEKPTLAQSIQAWALLNELLALGYPHNFQHEKPHISNYLFDLSALIDKALKIKKKER